MNKRLIKDLCRELDLLRANSVPLAEHKREVEKLKRDKANVTAALSTSNKALERACEELRKSKYCNSRCDKTICHACFPNTFRDEVKING